jgi:lipoprotein-anchoring transpeptidase ErfK/SrfK
MKLPRIQHIVTPILIVFSSAMLAYHTFSYYQPSAVENDDNDITITLNFPSQNYVISKRDIDALEGELVIPLRDDTIPTVSYDSVEGVVKSISSPQDYVIDGGSLRASLAGYNIGQDISFTPQYELRDRYSNDLAAYNLQLNKIYREPLTISLKDGQSLTDLSLDSSVLRTILNPTSTEINIPPEINRDKLISYITSHLTPKQKNYFNPTTAYQNTRRAIHARFMGETTPVVLGVDDGPTSSGELADRYLEVDLSQQKMYFFIGHTLYKEYRVSTGAEYPTPVGEFHILNKAPIAFSNIYNVWMPYWMGFKYASDVGAYLGLHEIAYASKNKKGEPVYNHGYYIGDMMTGGCVAMDPKDSREIYNLSEVGMLVRVVK